MKRVQWWIVILLLVGISLLAFACATVQVASVLGKISGRVLAADGTTAVVGASVYLKTDSSKSATTNLTGTFTLEGSWIVPGSYTLVAQKGDFKIEFSATVSGEGATTDVGSKEIQPGNPGVSVPDLAVIKGTWDKIENIITNLGYSYTTIEVNDVNTNYDFISTFEAIFINCGTTGSSLTSSGEANLLKFVETAGGSLYVSDYAADYLDGIWPNAINWRDGSVADAKDGKGSQSLEATVVNSGLQTVLGKNTASVYYDLGSWVVISSEGTGTSVLLRGSPEVSSTTGSALSVGPHASSIKSLSTITLNYVPLAAKFQPAGATKGTVIYTTFHNELQESLVTNDTKKILNDFIFGL